ncbi:MAG: hypothetical protein GC204_14955 [Chloroflexi bacterium]|nr:hypothetical protein [Chloroflexota bacterium]
MDSTTQVITTLIIVLALVVTVIVTQFIRRRKTAFPMRMISAYEAIPLLIGESIEAGRPMHVSFGSAGLGGSSTALTLASAELAYQIAARNQVGSTVITMSEPSALPLAYGTLRRAYASRQDRLSASSVRWYPAGTRSLAFAAALTGMLGDERVSGNVLTGSFGPEIALVLEAAARKRQSSIAGSVDLDGQAVAYAMADQALIGEELFVAGAYMGDSATQRGSVVTLDVLRWLLILGILIATANAIREPVLAALNGGK